MAEHRDMDERFAIDADPEDAVRAVLTADAALCPKCHHPMAQHRVTPHGRQEAVTCQVEGCDCHYERPRSAK